MNAEAKRQSVAAKIRALLAKTVENGCTEDEAVAAAAKAAELLEQYDLSLDEVEMRANPFARKTAEFDEVGGRIWRCARAIAELTHARYWTSGAGEKPAITFFGFDHEVAVASYLLAICDRAMRSALDDLDAELAFFRPNVRQRRRGAFLDGMVDSLARRIRAQIRRAAPGTGLVPLHEALIDEEMEKRGLKLRDARARGSNDLDPTYAAGILAGDAVALDPGVAAPEEISGLLGEEDGEEDPDDADDGR